MWMAAVISTVTSAAQGRPDDSAVEGHFTPGGADLLAAESSTAGMLAASVIALQDEQVSQDGDDALQVGERFTSDESRLTRFGEKGTWQFNLFASGAWGESNADKDGPIGDVEYFGGGFGVDYFLHDDFSIGAQLVGLSFTQDGPETAGGAFEVLLRWHFISESTWSIYLDGGAGFLKTSDDVPPHGTNFNFTPQAGAGFTIEIGGQMRAMTGVRWHHISNANSADSNPGIDSFMLYAGITVPF
jgi:hypothetical protein